MGLFSLDFEAGVELRSRSHVNHRPLVSNHGNFVIDRAYGDGTTSIDSTLSVRHAISIYFDGNALPVSLAKETSWARQESSS